MPFRSKAFMKIFFYHTEDSHFIYAGWERGAFPGHFLYGATHLRDHGIEMVMRRHRDFPSRLRMMGDTARQVLACPEPFDAIFATRYEGLEIIIMMRALGLFRKPIVVWHHQPIVKSGKWWRERLGRIFYRGMDHLFFFSRKLLDDSLLTGKVGPERMHIGHWGPDLRFYDKVISETRASAESPFFISTGRERRDMKTLVEAFNQAGEPLKIFTTKGNCGNSYEDLFRDIEMGSNVSVSFTEGYQQNTLCYEVARASCVVICCMETNYTCGLTTVVEAMALGKPIICSRNPQMPIDFDKERCGIAVDYYDVEGWVKAIRYVASHPAEAREMGRRARQLAEERFNDVICARDVAAVLRQRK